MKIVITDSGLGGLSICALFSQYLNETNHSEVPPSGVPATGNLEIIYVNAAPKSDLGYNQMETRELKLQTFNRVLYGIKQSYQPDYIFVACNTLSTLINDTPFAQNESTPIEGIIEIGVTLILNSLKTHPHSGVFILATDTTIDEKIYTQRLIQSNIQTDRIVDHALTGIATMISNDLEGDSVYQSITGFIEQALLKMVTPFNPLYVFLGCTHYGYRQAYFAQAFSELGFHKVEILNPNEQASQYLISKGRPSAILQVGLPPKAKGSLTDNTPKNLNISIKFVSQYPLPKNEITTISHFLAPYSQQTVTALQNYTLNTNLIHNHTKVGTESHPNDR